ncbi:RNA-binding protein 39 [Episyrphus balteatus]|uniref:RNA-binding protein 39 n=1 Tax=Episyrphus balteatus TaxID=286459 RepID=UPI0024862541|nr:RNA-binding protein 39 [Episyrphus balteatus]
MADDFDIEAMLEEPYQKGIKIGSQSNHTHSNGRKDDHQKGNRSSRSPSRTGERHKGNYLRECDRDKDRNRDRECYRSLERSRDRERRRSREKRGSKSRDRRRSRSGDRKCNRTRERDRRRSKSGERRSRSKDRKLSPIREKPSRSQRLNSRDKRRRSYSPKPFKRGRTPPNGLGEQSPRADLSPEERDARTVFCMQLSQRIRARDLEEFFSSVGKVRDVRLITCNKTKRFKGIAYIEFKDPESVALALGLSGQKLLGIPICVQHTQAEKNRIANAIPTFTPKPHTGPMRLYVGSLHFNITEEMLRGIFEPFGKIDSIQLISDTETGRSKGYGFITYHNADDAKKALEQLNGFELAGRPMKVGNVTERLDMNTTSLDTDEMDRSGIDLGATGRLQLMFKLAEGAGLAVPQAAANALLATAPQPVIVQQQAQSPTIATQCFMLSNMFDPKKETNPYWEMEIRDDVLDECNKHGGTLHIYVDKESPTGNVYVKCPSITTAVLAVNSLHGRWFAGRVITAAYVPLINYHTLFPDALTAVNLLYTTRKTAE